MDRAEMPAVPLRARRNRGPFAPAFISVAEAITLHARSRPNDPAFADSGGALTWGEFNREVNRLANGLIAAGVRKGDRVALLACNSIWAYTVIFGVMRAGAVVCPLSTLLTPQLVASLASDCGAALLLVEEPYEKLALDCRKHHPQLKLIIERGGGADTDYAALLKGAADTDPGIALSVDDRANVIYSSGTTGRPKGIVHTHGARVGFATQTCIGLRFHGQCRTLLTTGPNSNGTWMVMLPTVMLGGTTCVMGGFAPEPLFDAMRRHRPTHAFIVPTQARAVLDHPGYERAGFDRFECLVTAGAPMPDTVKSRMRELSGEKLYELWGFSESVGTIISPQEMVLRPQSVGRAWPGSDLRIVDAEGRDISGRGMGEIVGRTVSMMEGYLDRPDANAEIIWRDEGGRVFFRTGDIGELDADGYLTLRGRAKDMILSGGQNVFPVDIEAVLLRHEQIQDAAVTGAEDEKWGETPVAFIIARPGCEPDPAEIQTWANDQLAKFQRLSKVVLRREDFPRNTLGKVLKNELKAAYGVAGEIPRMKSQ